MQNVVMSALRVHNVSENCIGENTFTEHCTCNIQQCVQYSCILYLHSVITALFLYVIFALTVECTFSIQGACQMQQ